MGQPTNLPFLLLCFYFHSSPTDFFYTSQNNSAIIHKGWWLTPPRESSISHVGLYSSPFELLSHSHKKANLTKAAEPSEHLFRQQNWNADFLSCVITRTHTPCPRIWVRILWHTSETSQCRISETPKSLKTDLTQTTISKLFNCFHQLKVSFDSRTNA